jgi:hypothetical protein
MERELELVGTWNQYVNGDHYRKREHKVSCVEVPFEIGDCEK